MAQCKLNFQFLWNLEYECFVSIRKITARGPKIIYKYIKNRSKRFHVTIVLTFFSYEQQLTFGCSYFKFSFKDISVQESKLIIQSK